MYTERKPQQLKIAQRIEAPAVEPVTIEELKDHVRSTEEADNPQLVLKLKAAREWIESYTGRSLISQKWELAIDGAPCGVVIDLPHGPLLSVQEVKTFDIDDSPTVLDAGMYVVDTGKGSRIWLKDGEQWGTSFRALRSLTVRYTAGYGTTPASVPERARAAVLLMTAHLWENREAVSTSQFIELSQLPLGLRDLLAPLRTAEVLM